MKQSTYVQFKKSAIRKKLRDSKKLSAKQRAWWYAYILQMKKDGLLSFEYVTKSSAHIDRSGIAVCISNCVQQGLKKLRIPITARIMLDGSLYAPDSFVNQKTIIKGDELEPIISLASIVAKERRDEYMKKVSSQFPRYGFEIHKGYGTVGHIRAIRTHGPCQLHRKSFIRRIIVA